MDEQGRQERTFAPLIDGLLQGPNKLFALLTHYLQTLDVQAADQLLFVSDGARWIWNRLPGLLETLSLDAHKVHCLIDFFHAVEHLNRVAALRKDWTKRQRSRWFNKQRKLLQQGQVEQVIEAIRPLCRGRNSRSIRSKLNYFITHRKHMNYGRMTQLNLPIGSGAIESAIRRVVNLRLKGASIFWSKPNAEALLMVRAFYKAGRWRHFKSMAFSSLYALSQ